MNKNKGELYDQYLQHFADKTEQQCLAHAIPSGPVC